MQLGGVKTSASPMDRHAGWRRLAETLYRHCEERSDVAIHRIRTGLFRDRLKFCTMRGTEIDAQCNATFIYQDARSRQRLRRDRHA